MLHQKQPLKVVQEYAMNDMTTKQNRINIYCDKQTHKLLDKAAAHSHISLSEFVLTHARASAEQIVQAQESINLTEKDFQAFLAALDTPLEPNAALYLAFQRHAEQVIR